MGTLANKTCRERKGEPALGRTQAQTMLGETPGWALNDDAREISRSYKFGNYYETLAFVNALAWIVHREDHHPDLEVGYNRCKIRFSTHSVNGLSENDFICAAKINILRGE